MLASDKHFRARGRRRRQAAIARIATRTTCSALGGELERQAGCARRGGLDRADPLRAVA
ncbi:MAG: hypothetical protein ABIY55_33185 [Kofleriaceae bacterium]